MKVKVKAAFRDKFTKQMYAVGSVLELTDAARVKDLTDRGYVTPVAEPKKEEPAEEKPKKKKAAKKK